MIWFEKDYEINGLAVRLEGTYEDSVIEISAFIEIDPDDLADWAEYSLYKKPVNMWSYQEILAEDILTKYQGMIKKYELKLPSLVDKCITNKSI